MGFYAGPNSALLQLKVGIGALSRIFEFKENQKPISKIAQVVPLGGIGVYSLAKGVNSMLDIYNSETFWKERDLLGMQQSSRLNYFILQGFYFSMLSVGQLMILKNF